MNELDHCETAIHLIVQEYGRATNKNGPFHSAHEGYAVILEELDELKAEIWKNEQNRDYDKMMREAVQVAAMGIRFIVDICLKEIVGQRLEVRE